MAERVSRVEAECALLAAVRYDVPLGTWRHWRRMVRQMIPGDNPPLYREAALELMEMGRLEVQDEVAVGKVLAQFSRGLQMRISAHQRPDGRWEMTFSHAAEDSKAQT